ncbi:hypothetical protein XM38_032390 [Halomicronema hongdechloris C2206]|uniref:Nudix hydrolase domain-containing protein n=1 Tax=Halomicronema hongdechloris C2206 TaxID=1641165 RepID=A0A1Z3HPQ3_9CYAN|nr:NUDIX domain-containing protein [Halomicronema hongdechloris]ASC72283.1 hypothetical protein XM38_032390 [Halomicronema hongdechloris C2206]
MAQRQDLDAGVGVPHFVEDSSQSNSDSPYLPDQDYYRALQALVITCVDVLLVHADRVLLGRRHQPPRLGWWVLGGRMHVGESPLVAVQRKLNQEAGLWLARERFHYLGAYSSHFSGVAQKPAQEQAPPWQHPGLHSVNLTYFATLCDAERQAITLTPQEYAGANWFSLSSVEADLRAQIPTPLSTMDLYLNHILKDLRSYLGLR